MFKQISSLFESLFEFRPWTAREGSGNHQAAEGGEESISERDAGQSSADRTGHGGRKRKTCTRVVKGQSCSSVLDSGLFFSRVGHFIK